MEHLQTLNRFRDTNVHHVCNLTFYVVLGKSSLRITTIKWLDRKLFTKSDLLTERDTHLGTHRCAPTSHIEVGQNLGPLRLSDHWRPLGCYRQGACLRSMWSY